MTMIVTNESFICDDCNKQYNEDSVFYYEDLEICYNCMKNRELDQCNMCNCLYWKDEIIYNEDHNICHNCVIRGDQ